MHKPVIGVSSCLLGENVRYNGMHKRDSFIVDTLSQFVDFVGVCPEYESGMGVPREAMRLVGDVDNYKLLTSNTGRDMTPIMMDWIAKKLPELDGENLCGFIFKSRSPSSGMERVKIYNGKGGMAGRGSGLFAKAFMERYPLLPCEDDGRLNDPVLRENFIERIFTLDRYREVAGSSKKAKDLVRFHSDHKYLLMSHSEKHCRQMGKLVADGAKNKATFQEYEDMLLEAMKLKSTVRKHVNVLQHIMGYFKNQLTHDEKEELLETIENYRNEYVPLIVPITLLNHFERKYQVEYLKTQYYLHPHPVELKLRNHA
ncbi:hypothetical protein BVX97_04420 [bacterium E08(2017)]|nr:hypothetical protein BVX97_04420 [bacterium E08(2017)]